MVKITLVLVKQFNYNGDSEFIELVAGTSRTTVIDPAPAQEKHRGTELGHLSCFYETNLVCYSMHLIFRTYKSAVEKPCVISVTYCTTVTYLQRLLGYTIHIIYNNYYIVVHYIE